MNTTTDMATLAGADWARIERDVVERIRALRDTAAGLEQNPLTDKIANDLILPALRKLGDFCLAVELEYEPVDGGREVSAAANALRGLMALVEDGDLVRNTDGDGDRANFVRQGLKIANALRAAMAALDPSNQKERA